MEKQIQVIENLLNIQEIVGKNSFNKQEIIDIVKQADSILSVIDNETIKKDLATKEQCDTFNEIMSKITGTKKSSKYPDSVFHMVGDSIYMEQDLKTNIFYIKYYDFWSVFETKFELKYQEIKELLRGLLEHHLKCEVNTTVTDGMSMSRLLERHLKCEVN